MDFDVQRGFHLAGGAFEGDEVPAARGADDGQSLALEPRHDLRNVGRAGAEAIGVLFGSQPLTEVR